MWKVSLAPKNFVSVGASSYSEMSSSSFSRRSLLATFRRLVENRVAFGPASSLPALESLDGWRVGRDDCGRALNRRRLGNEAVEVIMSSLEDAPFAPAFS